MQRSVSNAKVVLILGFGELVIQIPHPNIHCDTLGPVCEIRNQYKYLLGEVSSPTLGFGWVI